jgi:hypothetical protein
MPSRTRMRTRGHARRIGAAAMPAMRLLLDPSSGRGMEGQDGREGQGGPGGSDLGRVAAVWCARGIRETSWEGELLLRWIRMKAD